MDPTIPTSEPTRAAAGDTWQWQRAFASYPAADGWVLSYAIAGTSILAWKAEWLADDGETVTIPADQTAPLTAGLYRLVGYMSRAGQRFTVYDGALRVTADISQAAPGGQQAFVERALAAVEAQITQLLATPIEDYTQGQRAARRRKLEELETLRTKYRAELRQMQQRRAGRFGRTIAVRFGSVSS